jgi:hypothetical protein
MGKSEKVAKQVASRGYHGIIDTIAVEKIYRSERRRSLWEACNEVERVEDGWISL